MASGARPTNHEPPATDNTHYVRRVVLPSGRAIEVVYFEEPGRPAGAAPPSPTPDRGPSRLPECDARRSSTPSSGRRPPTTHWEVSLRCPNCEWTDRRHLRPGAVDRFDEELDRGTEALVRDLKRLTRANMEDEIERFARALDSDAICPKTSRPLAVAVDDAVGHELERARAARPGSSGRSAFASATISSARSRASSSAPVAAIASHTASACSGVRTVAQVERGQPRIALAGEDERQRDRAVEQVGAAVLAGALGRARDVEHVVEQLEGEADPAPEARRARRPAPPPSSAPSSHAAWNSRAVLRSQRAR